MKIMHKLSVLFRRLQWPNRLDDEGMFAEMRANHAMDYVKNTDEVTYHILRLIGAGNSYVQISTFTQMSVKDVQRYEDEGNALMGEYYISDGFRRLCLASGETGRRALEEYFDSSDS